MFTYGLAISRLFEPEGMPKVLKAIEAAPTETDVCLYIEDNFGIYQLPFPCRFKAGRWTNARTGDLILGKPIGWLKWEERRRKIWKQEF
jgi:hypothetical protein